MTLVPVSTKTARCHSDHFPSAYFRIDMARAKPRTPIPSAFTPCVIAVFILLHARLPPSG